MSVEYKYLSDTQFDDFCTFMISRVTAASIKSIQIDGKNTECIIYHVYKRVIKLHFERETLCIYDRGSDTESKFILTTQQFEKFKILIDRIENLKGMIGASDE